MPERSRSGIKKSYVTIEYFKQKMLRWVYQKPRIYPWRTTKVKFHALVAEILLQRTKAEQVISVYRKFINAYPSPASLATSPLSKIKEMIASLGLQWRARKLKDLAYTLKNRYSGVIPIRLEDLITLPGVGPYAASAYLSLHNNKRALLVDSNIVRLYGRFFGFRVHAETRRNNALTKLIGILTPQRGCRRFNYAVLDLGRNICRPKPACPMCPVLLKCHYYNHGKG
jgi:A/G-specific adenine glycosylase